MPVCRTLLQNASGTFAYLQATAFLTKCAQPEAFRWTETHLWGRAWTCSLMRSAQCLRFRCQDATYLGKLRLVTKVSHAIQNLVKLYLHAWITENASAVGPL